MEVDGGGGMGSVSGSHNGTASLLVATVTKMMSICMYNGQLNDPNLFSSLCFSLAKGMDHAIANNEVPLRSHDLPSLLKQVVRCGNNFSLQASFNVLMTIVKNACKIGWFPNKENHDLIILAKEVGKCFLSSEDFCVEPSYALPYISKIMSRFYPKMKMGSILASLEVKPGYETFMADFHISRGMVAPEHEKICLFVAEMDNMDTSSCLITPPDVNFHINGKGVDGRTSISLDKGPQLPSNVTAMLKYGVNLMQIVGRFSGHYMIGIVIMSMITSSDIPELEDYAQPVVASVNSDVEMVEATSRISLNCPISQFRMRTPIKGHLCKHPQCFDYDNFSRLNSQRPFWLCPLCKQPVCHQDIRTDQNVVKILKEAGDDVVDVIISTDGSWKAVSENKGHSAQPYGKTRISQKEGHELCELWSKADAISEGLKTKVDNNQSFPAAAELGGPGVNNKYQNASSPSTLSAYKANFISNTSPCTLMQPPVLTDAVSLAYHRELVNDKGRMQLTASSLHDQLFNPNNYLSSSASNEFGRLLPVSTNLGKIPFPALAQNLNVPAQGAGAYNFSSRPPLVQQNNFQALNQCPNLVHASDHVVRLMQVQGPDGDNQATVTAQQVSQMAPQPALENPSTCGRMRGSLSGDARLAAISQFMAQPTQPAQASRQPSRLMPTIPTNASAH